MLPNGQRVSTLATEGARERATARLTAVRCCLQLLTRCAPQVDEECTKCGHRGLSFHTMQARRRGAAQPRRALTCPRRLCSCAPRTRGKPCSSSASHASTSGRCTHNAVRRARLLDALQQRSCPKHGEPLLHAQADVRMRSAASHSAVNQRLVARTKACIALLALGSTQRMAKHAPRLISYFEGPMSLLPLESMRRTCVSSREHTRALTAGSRAQRARLRAAGRERTCSGTARAAPLVSATGRPR